MQNYKPSKKEVAGEMTKVFAEGAKDFLKEFSLSAGALGVFLPNALPTTVRKIDDSVRANFMKPESAPELTGKIFGSLIGGSVLGLAQIFGYSQLYNNGYGEFCYIPLATNAASFAYEIGRCVYNKSVKNLAEKQHNSLEERMESNKNVC